MIFMVKPKAEGASSRDTPNNMKYGKRSRGGERSRAGSECESYGSLQEKRASGSMEAGFTYLLDER